MVIRPDLDINNVTFHHLRDVQVASYEFILNVTVNETIVPSPAATPLPPSPAPCRTQHIVNPRPRQCSVETPRRKVVATALRELLRLSTSDVKFSVSSAVVSLGTGVAQSQVSSAVVRVVAG